MDALIPQDKGDLETAEKLKNYTYEEVKDITPKLLEWIKDMNWPVAKPITMVGIFIIGPRHFLSAYLL